MSTFVRFVPAAALAALATLAGCPGGSDLDATFVDATPAQLERALQVGSGGDGGSAYFLGMLLSQQDAPEDCPRLVTSGATTTVTGGCDTDGGGRIEGRIVIENVPPFFAEDPDIDPDAPSSVSYDNFHVVDGDDDIFIDGVVELDPVTQAAAIDLTVRAEGIEATSQLTLSCDATDLCSAAEGGEVEIVGIGRAAIEGSWRLDEPAEGTLTLRGADTVVFDVGASADNCVPYTLADGTTGEVCDTDEQ